MVHPCTMVDLCMVRPCMGPRLTIRPCIIVDPSLVEDRRGRWRSHGGGVNATGGRRREVDRGACGSCALIFDKAGRHLRWINFIASVAERARHSRSAATASVPAFPRHVGMGLANPARSETARANVHHRSCSFLLIRLRRYSGSVA